ncbi:MAG TPA: DUF2442 domain-containing protein [Pseudobdellovibrionaceae bacterium]|nr:DUF2442 domain-containing protein [Pseudobdellovibrionaceae bacterium]
MLKDIIYVKSIGNKILHVKFEDGVEGEIDISKVVKFDGIFNDLKEDLYFSQVQVNLETGTIYWPNGADLCPDVLYSILSGESIENELNKSEAS